MCYDMIVLSSSHQMTCNVDGDAMYTVGHKNVQLLFCHNCAWQMSTNCRTTVCQSLKLPVVSNCDMPHQLLLIPRYRLRTFGRRAFAVAGPTFWNSLGDELQTYSSDRFKLALKGFLFATSVFSALEAFAVTRYIN